MVEWLLKPAMIMLTQPSTDPDRIPDFNPLYPVAMGTTTADANTLRNLYAPSSVWAKIPEVIFYIMLQNSDSGHLTRFITHATVHYHP